MIAVDNPLTIRIEPGIGLTAEPVAMMIALV